MILVVIFIVYRRRTQRFEAEDGHYDQLVNVDIGDNIELDSETIKEQLLSKIRDRFPTKQQTVILLEQKLYLSHQIIIGHLLGSGNFGSVHRATMYMNDMELEVAAKTLASNSIPAGCLDSFIEEAMLMSTLEHSNILSLLAISFKDDDSLDQPILILPLMINGDLLSWIRENEANCDLSKQMGFVSDIAHGMEYLSSKKIVHRDLAARNCMLDESMVVKVSDFGLSRDVYEKQYYHCNRDVVMIPYKWTAPESMEKLRFNEKSDVWSFGVCFWEVMTFGIQPFADVQANELLDLIKSGRRLRKPDLCPDEIYDVMLSCWNLEAGSRPLFSELVETIDNICSKDKPQDYPFRII